MSQEEVDLTGFDDASDLDERLDSEGAELLSGLVGCPANEVTSKVAGALQAALGGRAEEGAQRLVGLAGAVGALTDALADGIVTTKETLDLGAISGEAAADVAELIQLLVPADEVEVASQEEVEIDA